MILDIEYPYSNVDRTKMLSLKDFTEEMEGIQQKLSTCGVTLIVYYTLMEGKVTEGLQKYANIKYISNQPLAINTILRQSFGKDVAEARAKFYAKVQHKMEYRSTITAHAKKEVRFIDTACKQKGYRRILDMGCGIGRLSIPLAKLGYDVFGIDVSQPLIQKAKEQSADMTNITFHCKNILETDLRIGNFDIVLLMWHTLCEFEHQKSDVIINALRSIRRGGMLIFDIPDVSEKSLQISESGVYTDNSAIAHYTGYVPTIDQIFMTLQSVGVTDITYMKKTWGTKKIVFLCTKR